MTPPTPEQEDSALAALTGTFTERRPGSQLERDMLRVKLIAQAKEKGVPWPVIGSALGTDGKQAKKDFRALARRTQRTMLLEKARQDGITGKGAPAHPQVGT